MVWIAPPVTGYGAALGHEFSDPESCADLLARIKQAQSARQSKSAQDG
jgi:hypothetical protein